MFNMALTLQMFNFIPDDGRPPRLVRIEAGPRTGFVSKYDFEKNLVVINKGAWATLGQLQREFVLRSSNDVTWDDLPDEFTIALAAE